MKQTKEQETRWRKKYRTTHLEEVRAKDRANYYKRKDKVNKYISNRRKNNPKAREIYLVQMKTGKYPHKISCEICGLRENIQHHHFTNPKHEDYFIDVCKNCHSICERYDKLVFNRSKEFVLKQVMEIIDKKIAECYMDYEGKKILNSDCQDDLSLLQELKAELKKIK